MKHEVIVAGVNGQGVQTVAGIIVEAARRSNLFVSQPHLPRLSQRDGSVAHIRIADAAIIGEGMLRRGEADVVISLEPLESLGYVEFLRHDGALVTSTDPIRNIPNYPDIEVVLDMVRHVPNSRLVDSCWLAHEEGAVELANIVMLGAAANLLPIPEEELRSVLSEVFASGQMTLKAFDAGKAAVRNEHLVDEFAVM